MVEEIPDKSAASEKSIPKCHVVYWQAHRSIHIEWGWISFLKKDQDKSKKYIYTLSADLSSQAAREQE